MRKKSELILCWLAGWQNVLVKPQNNHYFGLIKLFFHINHKMFRINLLKWHNFLFVLSLNDYSTANTMKFICHQKEFVKQKSEPIQSNKSIAHLSIKITYKESSMWAHIARQKLVLKTLASISYIDWVINRRPLTA